MKFFKFYKEKYQISCHLSVKFLKEIKYKSNEIYLYRNASSFIHTANIYSHNNSCHEI